MNKADYKVILDNVKDFRTGKMVANVPFTDVDLLNNMSSHLTMSKEDTVAVFFTVEWAIHIKYNLGIDNVTVIVDADDTIVKNVCNFFEIEYVVHRKGMKMKKFDVTVGNPPYQDSVNSSTKLWNRFLELAYDITNDKGYIAFVTPLVWMKRPTGQAASRIVRKIMSESQVIHVDTTVSSYFNVGEEIAAYVIQKTPRHTDTKIVFADRETTVDYTGQKIAFTHEEELEIALYNKVMNSNLPKLGKEFYCDYCSDKSIDERFDRNEFHNGPSNTHTQKVYWTAANTDKYYADPSKSRKGIKIIINRSGYYYYAKNVDKYIKIDANDEFAVGVAGFGMSFDTIEQANNCRSYLTSKFYRWFVEYEKSGGYNTGVPKLAYLDINKAWTDKDVYAAYNLTDEEIAFIEENIA